MRLGLILFLSTAAQVLASGWGTNAWPAYQYPRTGDSVRESNVYFAIRERAVAIFGSNSVPAAVNSSAPSFWRSQRGNCASMKSAIRTSILFYPGWVPATNSAEDLQDKLNSFSTYAEANTNRASKYPTAFNYGSLLRHCYLPTNFFEYTPWRALSGLGAYTSSISVIGHPHGETNAFTVRGGTNFPAGRTEWYTTDYGWEGMRIVLTNLTLGFAVASQLSGTTTSNRESFVDATSYEAAWAVALTNPSIANDAPFWLGYKYGSPGCSDFACTQLVTNVSIRIAQGQRTLPLAFGSSSPSTNAPQPRFLLSFPTYNLPIYLISPGPDGVYTYDGSSFGYTVAGAWDTNLPNGIHGWQDVVVVTNPAGYQIAENNYPPDPPEPANPPSLDPFSKISVRGFSFGGDTPYFVFMDFTNFVYR